MALIVGVTLVTIGPPAAHAHETKVIGPLRITVGWGEEPALVGVKNEVSLVVTDTAGTPVADPAAALNVEISFGPERVVRALVPRGSAGAFTAAVVPTRAGTYAFHVTGAVRGTTVDLTSTCSDRTFDCVRDATEIEFPAGDPSLGQLTARLDREAARASRRAAAVAVARTAAWGAVAVACVALALAGLALRGRGRRG